MTCAWKKLEDKREYFMNFKPSVSSHAKIRLMKVLQLDLLIMEMDINGKWVELIHMDQIDWINRIGLNYFGPKIK